MPIHIFNWRVRKWLLVIEIFITVSLRALYTPFYYITLYIVLHYITLGLCWMLNVTHCSLNEAIWSLYKIRFILSAVDLIESHLIIGTFTIVTCVVIFIYMYLHAIKAYMNDIEYNFVFNVVKWNISFLNFHVCIYTHYSSLGQHKYFF